MPRESTLLTPIYSVHSSTEMQFSYGRVEGRSSRNESQPSFLSWKRSLLNETANAKTPPLALALHLLFSGAECVSERLSRILQAHLSNPFRILCDMLT